MSINKLKKIISCLLVAAISVSTTVFAYELPQEGEYETINLNCVDDAVVSVAADANKALTNASTASVALMGDGETKLASYQVIDMSGLENNVTPATYTFLKFDLSKIQEKNVYDVVLNLNTRIQGKHRAALNLYAADDLELDQNTDLANEYKTWDALLEDIDGNSIGQFKRPVYDSNTTVSWVQVDISTYIRNRARLGCSDATIMLEYKPETMNAVYWMAISSMSTTYAPYLTAHVPVEETVSRDLGLSSYANVKSNLSSGATEIIEETFAGSMSGNSGLNCYKLTYAGEGAEADPTRLFLQYDISNYLYDDVEAVSLDFIAKFVGNNAGVLNLYVADELQLSDLSQICTNYNNISGITSKINGSDLIATLTRASKTYTTGTELSMDVTAYIKNAVSTGKSKVTFMMEFIPSSTNSAYVCYVASNNSNSGPVLNLKVNKTPAHRIEYDANDSTVSVNLKMYEGSESETYTVKCYVAAYDNDDDVNRMTDVHVSEEYILDGTGTLISEEFPISDYSKKYIKVFVWDANLSPYYFVSDTAAFFDDVEGVFPRRIYTTTNDSANSDRNYQLSTYVDYLYNENSGILFEGESDHFDYPVITKNSQSTVTTNKTVELPLVSDKYHINKKVTTQTNTLMSKETGPIRLLCLGDSVTAGAGTTTKYWEYLQELFWKESIDFNDPSRQIMTLGTNWKGQSNNRVGGNNKTLTYEGVTETLHSHGEGRGGWKISDFLYTDTRYDNFTEEIYTKLGGTGTWTESTEQVNFIRETLYHNMGGEGEWTGSAEQLDYIYSHSMDTPDTTPEPDNTFYDGEKEGEIKFSINKWLERYRTHDENGQPLELGKGTGTYITEDNIDVYEVCEPTHVLIQFGHNDLRYYSEERFRTNLWLLVNEIKKELPEVTIIISMTPPSLGTYNPQMYPDIECIEPAGEAWFRNAAYFNKFFENYDEKANKVYLLPTYFVTPTAETYDNSGDRVAMPELHPNEIAHFQWGYQLYSLLKYMQ